MSLAMLPARFGGAIQCVMFVRPRFSLKQLLAEVLLFGSAMGLTRALLFWRILLSPGKLTLSEVIAYLACWVAAAGCWGAAIGGLFGRMKLGGRLAAYFVLGIEIAIAQMILWLRLLL
jgi:hypothetical protein